MPSAASLHADAQPPTGARRVGTAMQTLAAAMLILCVVSRVFVTEYNYRIPPLDVRSAMQQLQPGADNAAVATDPVNYQDLSRATYATVLLAACGLWLVGGAIAGRVHIRCKALAGLVAAFACCSLVSALRASDSYGAMLVWWEQLAVLCGGLLAAQVFADRRRLNLLLCVLAAAAAAVAVKGLAQVYDEFPATLANLKATPSLMEDSVGSPEGSTFSRLVRLRLGAMTPTGFFGMSNVLASLLLVAGAAAVGIMADRIAELVGAVAERRRGGSPVDISSPVAAAIVCVVPAALAVAALLMTGSTGAVGAAVLAGAAGVVVATCHRALRRHWRAAVLAAAAAGVVVAAATVGYGLSRDRLPTKTMTVRWYYWTASADIIRDEPLWGVGGGNFRDAYLLRRRAEAEELVKDPHNAAVSAAAQFGLIGGAAYLAALAYVLVGACRPRPDEPQPPPPTAGVDRTNGLIGCAAIAAVLVGRVAFGGAGASGALFIWNAVIPAAVFALALVGVFLAGRKTAHLAPGRFSRIALACGVGAFAVHNMVSFSLWTPGTATVFWVAGGALLAGGATRGRPIVRARWPMAVVGGAVTLAAAALLWLPIWRQTTHWRQVHRALRAGDVGVALSASGAAADTRGDPLSTADAASLRAALADRAASADRAALWEQATTLADLAAEQLPTRASLHSLAAGYGWAYATVARDNEAVDAAVDHARQAAQLDPMSMDVRLDYAEMLSGVGRDGQVLEQLELIEHIDRRLASDSVYRLSRADRDRISRLRAAVDGP